MGSRAFTGIARTVWHLTQDKEDESRRLFLAGKNNLAKAQTGLAFTIDGDPGSVRWESAPVTITADEAMADERRDNDGTTKLDEAKQWLKHRLENGPAPSNEIKVMARRDGITMKTLERAKKPLDVQSYPEEFGGKWMLALPQSSPTTTEFAIDKTMAETDELGGDCKTSHQLEEGF
jgi:putative DNA primase/helicase